ncbi:methyl-accepting chemotaxis protein [Wenxinia saemankumensis]|uniref:Methyl-accepting chemotaxis protein n=1 Tax=Wenxinia saemankumensis TaxID=1447782 RepID=A0A1M6HRL4_9RHOB|nr:HAMP domain-containing methyl-accepting chemotaxis protein [Wenxinia saemankumensis]SHJ24852.1 Methyl-accepting chemotaxis protein [Wenxinia saemankumensis]
MTASPRRPALSIFVQCLLLATGSLFAVAALLAWLNAQYARSLVVDGLTARALDLTHSVATKAGAALRFGRTEDIVGLLEEVEQTAPDFLASAILLDTTGEVVLEWGEPGGDLAAFGRGAALQAAQDRDTLRFAVPIPFGEDQETAGLLVTGWSSETYMADIARQNLVTYAICAAVAAVILVAFALAVRHMISRPLARLAGMVDRVAGGDMDTPIPGLGRGDEIGQIAGNLEAFRDRRRQTLALERSAQEAAEAQRSVVATLRGALEALSAGDVSRTIDRPFPGEYESLREAYNSTIGTLRDLLDEIGQSTRTIRERVSGMTASSDDLSRRTEGQAATLEEAAAALEEVTQSTRLSAESARDASGNVRTARDDTAEGLKVMDDAVAAMHQIEESSTQIARIINVIDDIAFQTNLLALNAGVEAARAGEAGRGFAVVASEVRALAQRSADAAKEIGGYIEQGSTHVGHGVGLVRTTGERLSQISAKVEALSDLVDSIATAATEQASGLQEINIGVGELDKATQQNAALVVESSDAARHLLQEADRLSDLVSRFSTDRIRAAA